MPFTLLLTHTDRQTDRLSSGQLVLQFSSVDERIVWVISIYEHPLASVAFFVSAAQLANPWPKMRFSRHRHGF